MLADGLPEYSRVKLAQSDVTIPRDTLLLASIADSLNFISWSKTKDAEKGRNRPKSIVSFLLGEKEKSESNNVAFNSPEEFEQARERIIKGG